MNRHQFFQYLSAVGAYGGGIAGVLGFVLRSRTGTWFSGGGMIVSGAMVFFLPLGVFARLLSKPLSEQSFFDVCLWAGVMCLYMLAGAIGIVRAPRTRSGPKNAPKPIASEAKLESH